MRFSLGLSSRRQLQAQADFNVLYVCTTLCDQHLALQARPTSVESRGTEDVLPGLVLRLPKGLFKAAAFFFSY